jgi:hypothetical protein
MLIFVAWVWWKTEKGDEEMNVCLTLVSLVILDRT